MVAVKQHNEANVVSKEIALMGLRLPPTNRVRIVPNKNTGDYEVHKGIFVVTHGPLWKCENYCQINKYHVCNQTEVNAVKRGSLPIDVGIVG